MVDCSQDDVWSGPPTEVPDIRSKTDAIRVLFVEDDELYREALADELSGQGFTIESFADAASLAVRLDDTADFDVILLDWSLPQTSGIDLLSQLRRRGIDLPVVFLTGHSLTSNEILAFERGAIDFIDKTRGGEVLMRRLRLVVDSAARRAHRLRQARSEAGDRPSLLERRRPRADHRRIQHCLSAGVERRTLPELSGDLRSYAL